MKKLFYVIWFFLFINFYHSAHALDIQHSTTSDWWNGYCYKFVLSNNTSSTLYDWRFQFNTPSSLSFTSTWWGVFSYNSSNNIYTVTWLDRNKNLQIWTRNIEIWFCTNSPSINKPSNVLWVNSSDTNPLPPIVNPIVNNFSCALQLTKTLCESGEAQNNCYWNGIRCSNLDGSWSDTLPPTCGPVENISLENKVKNPWFEEYYEWNIQKSWISRLIWAILRLIGLVNDLPYWTSSNDNFKLWANSEIPAIEWLNFLELSHPNSVRQNVATSGVHKYRVSFKTLWWDKLEVKWNDQVIYNAFWGNSWQEKSFIVDGRNSTSRLEFRNIEKNPSNIWIPIASNENNCTLYQTSSTCTSGARNNICAWENNTCTYKTTNFNNFQCGRSNANNTINLNSTRTTLPTWSNNVYCNQWNKRSGNTITSGNGNDIFQFRVWDKFTINMWNGNNIFKHTIRDSQLENSTIEWWEWVDTFIIEDEYESNISISWDCSNSCRISLKNNLWTFWQGWRFKNVTLKNINTIRFRDWHINYWNIQLDEYITETSLRLWIDDIKVQEILIINPDETNLMDLIEPELINYVKNQACTQFFQDLESDVKNELLEILSTSESYDNIGKTFFDTLSYQKKFQTVQSKIFDFTGWYIDSCKTNEEIHEFYARIYQESMPDTENCLVNNINKNVEKQVAKLQYLLKNGATCRLEENKIFINFLNGYSGIK